MGSIETAPASQFRERPCCRAPGRFRYSTNTYQELSLLFVPSALTTGAARYSGSMRFRLVWLLASIVTSVLCQPVRLTTTHKGDGGLATNAEIDGPSSVALDRSGNIYTYELAGGAIRKIGAVHGTITTVLETCHPLSRSRGCAGAIGDLGVAASSRLVFSEFTHNRIGALDLATGALTVLAGNGGLKSSGDGGRATKAGITVPHCMALDTGDDMLVCDSSFYIRRINIRTGLISRVAGNGERGSAGDNGPALDAQLEMPESVAVDRAHNIYVSDALVIEFAE